MIAYRRRSLIAGLAATPFVAAASKLSAASNRSKVVPLGLTDMTVMKSLQQDYQETLRKVAAMGYTHFGFRLAGYSLQDKSELSGADKAAMVRQAGMEVGVVRYGYGRPFAEQAETAAAIGASVIAYSAAPIFFRGGKLGETTRAAFDAWLPELRQMAQTARRFGVKLAYHNHWWDHAPLGGSTPLDIISKEFSPAEVAFEIDLAWAWAGGADLYALLKKLGRRVISIHLKDVDPALGGDQFHQSRAGRRTSWLSASLAAYNTADRRRRLCRSRSSGRWIGLRGERRQESAQLLGLGQPASAFGAQSNSETRSSRLAKGAAVSCSTQLWECVSRSSGFVTKNGGGPKAARRGERARREPLGEFSASRMRSAR